MAMGRAGLLVSALVIFLAGGVLPAQESADPVPFRVMAYNIHHGEGNDRKLDLERIAKRILKEKPDVVTLQEVDVGVKRTGGADQAGRLGELTSMNHAFGEFFPYQGGRYGMAILSRHTIVSKENHRLPKGAEPRTALAATLEVGEGGPRVVVVGIHLYRTGEERLAQAKKVIDLFKDEKLPVILAGDFNSTPDSEVMKLLGRNWTLAPKGKDRLTFSSDRPRIEIDYIMVRPESRVRLKGVTRVLDEPVASDHRPLVQDLELLPEKR